MIAFCELVKQFE